MYNIMFFVHLVSATLLGFYLILPFMWGKSADLLAEAQYSYIHVFKILNRVGQFTLLVLFITGGYMVSHVDVSITWMIVSIALLVVIGALTGIIGSKMKKLLMINKSGKMIIQEVSKVSLFIWLNGILVLATLYLMVNRNVI